MNEQNNELVRPAAAHVQRAGFGSQEMEVRRETQGSALAERQRAEVQARYIVAMQRPRNLDDVRIRLLSHCKRLGFAERAEYAKPVGGSTVYGASIRFVETALQEYGNVLPDSYVTYDDDERRIIRVSMTDLERNITYHEDVVVVKLVEKRKVKAGDVVLRTRENSSGGTTYVVKANDGEAELENRYAAELSKKTRKLGLRILPIDLVDEAIWTCQETIKKGNEAVDPAAARRRITDSFAELGVMPSDLDAFLGHRLDASSPAELDELRKLFRAVREGETTWAEIVENRQEEQARKEAPPAPQSAKASAAAKAAKAREETRGDAQSGEGQR